MSTPTTSIPRSQKRWPISTIFTPENMHAIFVPYSCRHPFNSRFICGNSWKTIVPHSSSSSYHLRSAKIFQLPANQPIPQFPNFPNFPRFPRIPAFPCFPRHPVHPFHPFLFMVQFVIIHGDIQKPLSFSARPGGESRNLSKNN